MGRGSSKFDNAYTWMLLMLFELFHVGFGQAIASISPNELLASLLVPILFIFVVSFGGAVVPYVALPHVSHFHPPPLIRVLLILSVLVL